MSGGDACSDARATRFDAHTWPGDWLLLVKTHVRLGVNEIDSSKDCLQLDPSACAQTQANLRRPDLPTNPPGV